MKITSLSALDYIGMTATLPLADGVTTLTGPNAGGKTMLTSVAPGILFGESKIPPNATLGMTWEGASGPGSMFVTRKNNKTVYRGTINGDSKEHNTIKPSMAWLREHFPVSQAAFSTANYLAAFRASAMLGGAPAARQQLLAEIVRLRVFDDWRSGLGKMAQSANVTIAMRKRLIAEIAELQTYSATSSYPFSLAGLASDLAERRSDIKSEAMDLARSLDDRPYGNVPTDALRKALDAAPARNKAWDTWEEYEKLRKRSQKVPSETDFDYASIIHHAMLSHATITHDLLSGDTPYVFGYEKLNTKLIDTAAQLQAIEGQLEHLENHDGKNCPTCGTTINGKALVKALVKTHTALKAEHKELRHKVPVAKVADGLRAVTKSRNLDHRALPSYLDNYQEVILARQEYTKLTAKFGDTKPKKPDKMRLDVGEITAELKLRDKGFGMLADSERKYDVLTKKFEGATAVLTAVTDIVEEQSETLINVKRLRSLRTELKSLPNSDDAELMLDLMVLLENKNARNKYLELVAAHLIDKLNELAPAYFPYRMEFAWTNGKLVANRKGGTTDVVLLSGREGRTFMLLNAVAIQWCLPPSRRLRTLILDELEAGSSPENRALLAELIPSLLEHYDNICVVTPLAKNEFYLEGPRYSVVENKGRKSLVRLE